MKVKHLIERLKKFDPELEVVTEGCDCNGDTYSVVEMDWNPLYYKSSTNVEHVVYIGRSDDVKDEEGDHIEYDNKTDAEETK